MLKIGITGGIGSGKSTVCKVFETLGIPVYYADTEAKKLLDTDTTVFQLVRTAFGEVILNDLGKIDRKKMAAIVFADDEKLAKLNSIIHPAVAKHFEKWLLQQKNAPYILKEAAILFESGANKQVDKVIAVTAPLELRIERIVKRDNVSEKEVKKRIKNQWTEEEIVKRSDYVIINDEVELVVPRVMEVHQELVRVSC